jgi:hypothetical protein
MPKKKPWRTLVHVRGERVGRFTAEQVEAAVLAVKARSEARRRKEAERAKAAASPPLVAPDAAPQASEGREVEMAHTKKPWRTVLTGEEEQVGRFTREQIRAVVRSVREKREARASRALKRAEGTRSRAAGATASAPLPEKAARGRKVV